MSYFRPGGRNKTHLMRPMVELQAETGFDTSRKLMRWGAKNSLMNDFHVKRPWRNGRWRFHEPQWIQRKRWIREYWTRRWKGEVRNTAHMALWWKFRVNATESYDREQYENYLKQREDKRLKELKKENSYQAWNLRECIEEKEYISYTRSVNEEEYLNSMQPESFLKNLRTSFLQQKQNRVDGYNLWKNDINSEVMNRAKVKHMESNQNIQLNGINDVKGYDWITYNKRDQSVMVMDDDVDAIKKVQLIKQNERDRELMNRIIDDQKRM